MKLLAAKANKTLQAEKDKEKGPYGTDDPPDPDAASSSSACKKPRYGPTKKDEKDARYKRA
eukprot:14560692-Heterocapsa_arctica.AAC.1